VDSGEAKPSMPSELLYPLLATIFVMLAFYLFLLLLRFQTEKRIDTLNQLLAETQD
jgi:Flp pilus assembly protein TadB